MTPQKIIPIVLAPQEWRYGLYFRPAGIGAVPNGFSRVDEANSTLSDYLKDICVRHDVQCKSLVI